MVRPCADAATVEPNQREVDTYIAVECDVYFGPSDVAIVRTGVEPRPRVVPKAVGLALETCVLPNTLRRHVDRVASVCGIQVADAEAVVCDLVAQGLMCEYKKRAGHDLTNEIPEHTKTVGIVTADRPRLLRCALTSCLDHCRHVTQDAAIIVADGSRTQAAAYANEEVVRTMSAERAAQVMYVGAARRKEVRQAAIRAGCAADVAHWILPEPPNAYAAGAVRNLLMLRTAGWRVVTVDDDVVCVLRRPGWCKDGLSLVGHSNPRETTWRQERSESLSAGEAVDGDVFTLHDVILGRTVHEIAATSRGPLDVDRACRHLAVSLRTGKRGRVRASWCGIAGDSAQYCPHWNLFATGATRELLATDEHMFRLALTSREVIRAVPQVTITDEPDLMTYCAGLDGSRLLPPFNPVGFNEDGLFGAFLRLCDPDALVGQVPYAIVHDSQRPARYEHVVPRSAAQVRLTEIVRWLVANWAAACPAIAIGERMKDLGRYLCMLASDDVDELRRRLQGVVTVAKCRLAAKCESVLASGSPCPAYWRTELGRYRNAVLKSLDDDGYFVPIEYKNAASLSDAIAGVREHLRMLGQTLIVWPDIWAFMASENEARSS
jgi:hypothetical protein